MPRRRLALLLLLLVVTRAALVLSLADVFFYGEELAKGAAAKAMLDGIPLEHWKLNYVYHEGGGFVVTHLKALAFLLVGENVLAHKLVAVAITSLILAAGFRFVLAAFGLRAATVFGVLFVFAPAAFVRFSLLNLGTHFEALLFLTLIAHFTLRIAESELARGRHFLGLGFTAGFGLYFSLQTAPAIAASVSYLLLFARSRLAWRRVGLAALAFLGGISPLLYMVAKAGADALRVRGQQVGAAQGTHALAALAGLFEPLASQGDIFDWIAVVAYPLVIVLGLVGSAAADPQRRRALLPVFVLVFFLAAYAASGFATASHGLWTFFWRLSTPWFFGNMLFAAATANLLARRSHLRRALAVVAISALVVAGIEDVAVLLRTGTATLAVNARQLVTLKGYDYILYFDKLKTHLEGDEQARISVLLRFEDDPAYLLPSIEHSLFDRSPRSIDEVLAIARASYGPQWLEGLKGLGPYFAPGAVFDVRGAFRRLAEVPEEAQTALGEAIGRTGRSLRPTSDNIEREIAGEDVPEPLRPSFWRGTGWRLYQINCLQPQGALARIERAAEPARAALRAGFEAAERARSLSRTARNAR